MNLFRRNIGLTSLRQKKLDRSTLTTQLWQFTGSAIVNLAVFVLVAAYLSPLVYLMVNSVQWPEQSRDSQAPIYPAFNPQYHYQGVDYPVMAVPTEDGVKEWAIIKKRRTYAEFIDPQNPETGVIHWVGNWYGLKKVYHFGLSFKGFNDMWKVEYLAQPIINTLIIAAISEIGVLASSIAVAYGFSRFRIPYGKLLFLLLISTILIPDNITIIPTYITFLKLIEWLNAISTPWHLPFSIPWVWVPLIAPHFFGSAIFVFLLRQNFRSIPRDLDEAAMLDGAGPLRILTSIILPQSIPVVATVALLHFFYIWNEVRHASLYLSYAGREFSPISMVSAGVGAGALLILIVPVAVLFIFQRFFMKDMVVTGQEK